MKQYIFPIILGIMALSCDKKQVDPKDVLTDLKLSATEVAADGQSTIDISVELNDKASPDRRSVIFRTTNGVFVPKDSAKVTVKAEFIEGKLIASTKLRVSTQPGSIKVSVKPEFDHPSQEIVLENVLTATPSVASGITLNPSGFGLTSNFGSEVSIVATLINNGGKFVSAGHKVVFEDFLVSGEAARGRFRNLKDVTSDSSVTKVSYAAAQLPVGTDIIIKATVLDSEGVKTNITDLETLTINQ